MKKWFNWYGSQKEKALYILVISLPIKSQNTNQNSKLSFSEPNPSMFHSARIRPARISILGLTHYLILLIYANSTDSCNIAHTVLLLQKFCLPVKRAEIRNEITRKSNLLSQNSLHVECYIHVYFFIFFFYLFLWCH